MLAGEEDLLKKECGAAQGSRSGLLLTGGLYYRPLKVRIYAYRREGQRGGEIVLISSTGKKKDVGGTNLRVGIYEKGAEGGTPKGSKRLGGSGG